MKKPPRLPDQPRPRWQRWLSFESLLWLAVVVLLVYRIGPQVQAAFGTSSDGVRAPSLSMATLDGRALNLADLRGQVVLVNFWATWCPPCRLEMPGFQKVYAEKKASGFTIVGLSADDGPRGQVVDFLRERNIDYPVAMATAEAFAAFGGVNSFPTSFLIDRQGRIRYTVRGIFAELTLRQAVDRLLAEP